MYMLAHLQPSEDVTGGAWFTDGELDEEFIKILSDFVERYVTDRSWVRTVTETQVKVEPGTGTGAAVGKMGKEQAEKARSEALDTPAPQQPPPKKKQAASKQIVTHLPFPPGFTGYPTVTDVMDQVNNSGITQIRIKEDSIQQLLDILCFDGRLVAIRDGEHYKSSKRPGATRDNVNGLTQAPCGRCPVFNLCEEGGPVNATNCEYFQSWLNF